MKTERKSYLPDENIPRDNREHSEGGIKFFAPKQGFYSEFTSYNQLSVDFMRYRKKVWRPEETVEAAAIFFNTGKINIVGAPQWGKGTILFGLSEMYDELGKGYVFINGHHQDTPTDQVILAIQQADEKGYAIFYDAFDHSFAGSRKGVRTISLESQASRTPAIVDALSHVSVPVAITSHDEEWAKQFLNLELRAQSLYFLEQFPTYEIPLCLQSSESIYQFLVDHDIDPEYAQFLIAMEQDPEALQTLVEEYGDKDKATGVFDAIKTFPVLKELVHSQHAEKILARGRREEVLATFQKIDRDKKGAIVELGRIIREAEMKRVFLTILRRSR